MTFDKLQVESSPTAPPPPSTTSLPLPSWTSPRSVTSRSEDFLVISIFYGIGIGLGLGKVWLKKVSESVMKKASKSISNKFGRKIDLGIGLQKKLAPNKSWNWSLKCLALESVSESVFKKSRNRSQRDFGSLTSPSCLFPQEWHLLPGLLSICLLSQLETANLPPSRLQPSCTAF